MLLRHLALAVQDEQRSRAFYERWFGFGVAPPRRYFGFTLEDPAGVRELHDALAGEGVEIAEFSDEPDYVSVKCRDPDGYVVEAAWESD
jgi:catechol 2,3-dioxygenase-like lactoylglutathione lyase family enzyme